MPLVRPTAAHLLPPPAGVKLHPPLCELLGGLGIAYSHLWQHAAALAPSLAAPCLFAGLAAAFAVWGLERGLLALRALLLVAAAPATAAYLCMAAVLRWHGWSTWRMWLVIRGEASLPRLRHRLRRRRRRWAAAAAAAAGAAAAPVAAMQRQGQGQGAGPAGNQQPASSGGGATQKGAAGAAPSEAADRQGVEESPDLQQLTAASLLFPTLLLLLPTTYWFYAYALLLHGCAAVAGGALQLAAQLVEKATVGEAPAEAVEQQQQQVLQEGSSQRGSTGPSGGSSSPIRDCELVAFPVKFQLDQMSEAACAGVCCTTYVRPWPLHQHAEPPPPVQRLLQAAWSTCGFVFPAQLLWAAACGHPVGVPVAFPRSGALILRSLCRADGVKAA